MRGHRRHARFFRMGNVVDKTKSAVETASADLRKAFAKSQQ